MCTHASRSAVPTIHHLYLGSEQILNAKYALSDEKVGFSLVIMSISDCFYLGSL